MPILTVGPTSTYDSITSAMLDALPGDTIFLEAGYSNEAALVTQNNLTIFGEAGSLGITLQLSLGIPAVTLTGTAPIDVLGATDGNGIVGNAGDNEITVTGGVDAVDGGLGNDRLVVDYRLATGAVTGDSTSNFTEAGGGGRSVTVTNGTIENFTILTGSEADTITTGSGNDIIRTGDGASTVNAGQGANIVAGGDDADTITVLDGGNEIDAGNGANTITTGSGIDIILTGTDADSVGSGDGDDVITLLGGTDSVDAGAGSDRLIIDYSMMTGDVVGGITGGNTGIGYTGHIADAGTNVIDFVGAEQFAITTGSGNDSIVTGGGNDTLRGGGGNDTLSGGAGADVIVLENGMGDDTVTDFVSGEDRLDISRLTGAEQISITSSTNDAGDRVVTLQDGSTLTLQGVPGNSPPAGAVVIEGTALEDESLTANISDVSDADGLGTFAFQWSRGVTDITGATDNSYQLTQADVGQAVSVRATYTDTSGTAETVRSSATAAVGNANDAPTGEPVISGAAIVGGTLNVSTTSIGDEDGLGNFAFQWMRDGSVILGANAATYEAVAADVGQALSVAVNYTDGQGTAESLVSSSTTPIVSQSPGQIISGTEASEALIGGTGADNISGAGGDDVIIGGVGNDDMGGGIGNDTMDGSDGQDTMGGGQGDDVMDGGNGNDSVSGGPGNDNLSGAAGSDTIGGSQGDDTIDGGAGDDSLGGGTGRDHLSGGTGNDTIGGGAGDDIVEGDAGHDFLVGGGRNDVMAGGIGDDTINGGTGEDFMDGGLDDDVMDGGSGNDTLDGGDGNDMLDGGFGNDFVFGGEGRDNLVGGQGDDILVGGAGDDSLGGGSGKDWLSGNEGDDSIGGGEGDDTLEGDAGNDFLAGGGRNDWIDGGLGDDTINGGDGDDVMTGGAGADVFVFNFLKVGDTDFITDYEDGVDSFLIRTVNLDTGEENISNDGNGLQGYFDALGITDTAGGAQVNVNGHLLLVAGIAAVDLTVDDFQFL